MDKLPIAKIIVVDNYRKTFDEKKLKELENSIRQHGVIEPVVVRLHNREYQLIAGERRVRAALRAGLIEIPVVVRENVSDEKFYELQMIENLQREGINVVEEARGVRRLVDKCDMTVDEIAKKLSKHPVTIYSYLSILKMHPAAIEAAESGQLTRTVAVIIAKLEYADQQEKAALDLRRSVKSKLVSERFARQYIQDNFGEKKPPRRRNAIQKEHGNDYEANWKKYLLTFNAEQFASFVKICNGSTATSVFAGAVEMVMLESEAEKKSAIAA